MKLLFVINQFYKGGAEVSLLNLLRRLDPEKYSTDLIIMNQCHVENAVSLIESLPKHIRVFDVIKEEKRFSLKKKIKSKFVLTKSDASKFPRSALLFAQENYYDWAFHIGEWWSPDFVSQIVRADRKAAWMHNDLSEAEYFDGENFFVHDNSFYKYIFVSKLSLSNSLKSYPFIEKKSVCVYNINDTENIRSLSTDSIPENYFDTELPVLVTCANVRAQKNHMRQLQAMKILKDRGVDFLWLNVGATTDAQRCDELRNKAKEFGLEDRFILTGPRENPYKYMAKADAVTVLSNYESWSMVITEAKILGVPIIATKTSGALEQIEHEKTGLLTDFTAKSIADEIEKFLSTPKIAQTIRQNLSNFDNTEQILKDFYELTHTKLEKEPYKNELLYIIDDINYLGGAHIATKLQIQALLKENHSIAVFSGNIPNVKTRSELNGVRFMSWAEFPEDCLFHRRLIDCLLDPKLSKEEKAYKRKLSFEGKIKKNPGIFEEFVFPNLSKLFSDFECVCVMSEGSSFRKIVADSKAKRKVQWIHIDYCLWKDKTEWNRTISKNDSVLYQSFDKIVVLSESIKESFCNLYPHLKDKVVINANLIPADNIKKLAEKKENEEHRVHFVTVGRIDAQKAYDRLFEVLTQLYDEGFRFYWTIIGGGDDYYAIQKLFASSKLNEYVTMTGPQSNPFPYVKDADVFALMSDYEGLPNTIFESLILGTPVIATKVGGVSTQIQHGHTGWLVENTFEAVYEGLKHILLHPEEIKEFKKNLESYNYDNEQIMANTNKIFFGDLEEKSKKS